VERFSHIGGHPAVDLVNTVHWRLDLARRSDRLESMSDVLAWSQESQLLSDAEADRLHKEAGRHRRIAAAELQRTLRLREAIYESLMGGEVARLITDEYREAIHRASFRHRQPDGSWAWTEERPDLHTPRHRLSRAVLALLSSPEVAQVRQCQDDACGWIFLDQSPRRNRRWCVSAECGNRNRVRRHYQRRSSQQSDRPTQEDEP
jgi:predicted RNA-binding Zn ribbon-like protein